MSNCELLEILGIIFFSLIPFLALFSFLASKNNFIGRGKVYGFLGLVICFILLFIGAILEGLVNSLNGC
jgi:hypothetical protein